MRGLLESFAVVDNNKRREFIIKKLEELNCPYFVQHEKMGNDWVQNIIVRFGPRFPKVMVGAHYDTVENSTGANDNGSGVCILLKLIESYIKAPQTIPKAPLEFVFFDCEEGKLYGSASYLFRTSPEVITAMINLDTCGVGDTILLAPAKSLEGNILGEAINKINNMDKYNVKIVEEMPLSDEQSFIKKGIPAAMAFTINNNEVEDMIKAIANNEEDSEKYPSILQTIHGGKLDSIDCIEERSMEMILNWVKDVLASF